jgi:DNA-binding transcriptional ArsR family regulator
VRIRRARPTGGGAGGRDQLAEQAAHAAVDVIANGTDGGEVQPGGAVRICDLNGVFELSQPAISHHMKVRHEAGLVGRDKRGVWVYYRIRRQALASLSTLTGGPPQWRRGLGPQSWAPRPATRGQPLRTATGPVRKVKNCYISALRSLWRPG